MTVTTEAERRVAPERLDRFDSQRAFRVLLDTASRPGDVRRLPLARLGAIVVPLALADVETTVAVLGAPSEQTRVLRATGATTAAVDEAELVACCGRTDAATIDRLRRGSTLAPEGGAKVGIDCHTLRPAAPGAVTLTLSGPGIDGTAVLGVDGVDRAVFYAVARADAGFPAGIDVWLVDGDGRVAGLPRSTRWEVS
jgi:alpha-D-ribose 1-methylphosphonate 5-triphosphate synthase subunit PhnH